MAPASPSLGSAASVLGWLATYLIHSSLWIAGAWLVARWIRSVAWRERLWKGALLGGFASAFLVTSLGVSDNAWHWQASVPRHAMAPAIDGSEGEPDVVLATSPAAGLPLGSFTPLGSTPASESSPNQVPQFPASFLRRPDWARIVFSVWILGAALGLVHLVRQHLGLRRTLSSRRRLSDGPLIDRLDRLRRATRLRKPVRLSLTSRLSSPVALARGEIVVPERAPTRLSGPELDSLLAHELAHIERRDPWSLLFLAVLQRLFFVQPLNRLAAGRASDAAEMRCDELAAEWTHGEVVLARCLAEVASWLDAGPSPRLLPGMAEHGSALVERVEHLLAPRRAGRFQGLLVGSWFLAGLAALACAGPRVGPERETQSPAPKGASNAPSPAPQDNHFEVLDQEAFLRLKQLGYVQVSRPLTMRDDTLQFVVPGTPNELRELGYVKLSMSLGQALESVPEPGSEEQSMAVRRRLRELGKEIKGLGADDPRRETLIDEFSELEQQWARLNGIVVEEESITRAIDLLDDRPDEKTAFHMVLGPDGVDPQPTAVQDHAIEIHEDGSIWCGRMQLCLPGTNDRRLLRIHMAEIARCMPRAPRSPDQPGSPDMPDGRLEIRIDQAARVSGLQHVLKACAAEGTRIWKLSLVAIHGEERGRPTPLELPIGLFVSIGKRPGTMMVLIEPIGDLEPGSTTMSFSSHSVQVSLDGDGWRRPLVLDGHVNAVFASARGDVKYSLSYPLDGEVPETKRRTDPAGKDEDLERLTHYLGAEHATRPGRLVTVFPHSATRYLELALVLEALIQSGFRGIDVKEARGP